MEWMMSAEQDKQATVSPARPPRKPRPTRVGVVTSDRRAKTIGVMVEFTAQHTKYGKYLRRRRVLHAHDEANEAHVGDRVEIAVCRPLSKTKSWRLVRILEKAPGGRP